VSILPHGENSIAGAILSVGFPIGWSCEKDDVFTHWD